MENVRYREIWYRVVWLMTRRDKKTWLINVVQYSRSESILEKKSVLQTQRVHLYPFRTQKLSSAVATILCGRPHGKIAQCWHRVKGTEKTVPQALKKRRKNYEPFNGGVAQLGEHLPCKQGVMGSNPIISTRNSERNFTSSLFTLHLKRRVRNEKNPSENH